jgi:alpha,alpha-trehalase
MKYINDEAIRNYLGGIPTSLELTQEQWDFPNAWPPLQIIVIQGLMYTKDRDANNLAYELAKNWIYANHKGYLDTNEMFEKVRLQYFIEFSHTFNSLALIIQMWEPCEPLRSVNY